MIEKKAKQLTRERAIMVGVITKFQTEEKIAEYLDELAFLADTAGADVIASFTQKLEQPHPKTFVGSGKLDEITAFVAAENIDLVIFDDELTPSQLKNLEKHLEIKVLDRTNLILDIFAARARTSYARTQVELAQYEYLLPRLTRMWTHLERQKGGIGMRGPGETQIETDRRIIKEKISLLKEKLEKIDRQMATQRGNRGELVRAALVGYTNVGKSTLMNLLSKSDVFAENKLFATLDTTVRKVVIHNLPFLLADTVGFIRKLPTQLIESFKSTLDEVREADVLIHVVDLSHKSFADHIKAVNETIAEIDPSQKPVIMVFNKIDAYQPDELDEFDLAPKQPNQYTLDDWMQTWMNRTGENAVFISATTRENVEGLREQLYQVIRTVHQERYPYNNFLFP